MAEVKNVVHTKNTMKEIPIFEGSLERTHHLE